MGDMAHNLYSIQRKEEAIKTSVSATLPILLDQQKEIVGIACGGNVKKMLSLMITQNISINDLLASENNVFRKVCLMGNLKLLILFESMMSRKEFIERIFISNKADSNSIEGAVNKSQSSIVKYLMDMDEVKNRYKDNDPLIF